jgi:hypothetical protein
MKISMDGSWVMTTEREAAIQAILTEVGKGYTIDEAVENIRKRPAMTKEPTLDDRTRALTAGVVRNVQRDLSEHDIIKPSDPHDCSRRDEQLCAICDGGLAVCRRCNKFEGGLEEPCKPRVLSGVHDSDTCDLGSNDLPCNMCVEAARIGARKESDLSGAENVPSEPQGAGIDTVADGKGSLWASASTIRTAITDVLNTGYPFKNHAKPCPWLFFHDESDEQTELRGSFTDMVVARLRELQSPPHNAPRLGAGRDQWL